MATLGIDQVEVSKPFMEAAAWRARYLAHLTGHALQRLGIVPAGDSAPQVQLPAQLLLEFGAVLQLALWEQDGFTAHLDAGLPCYSEAFAELAEQAERGGWDEGSISTDSLSFQVFKLSLNEFSWDAPVMLGVEMQLKAEDEEAFVEQLAEFLWRSRQHHSLSHT